RYIARDARTRAERPLPSLKGWIAAMATWIQAAMAAACSAERCIREHASSTSAGTSGGAAAEKTRSPVWLFTTNAGPDRNRRAPVVQPRSPGIKLVGQVAKRFR